MGIKISKDNKIKTVVVLGSPRSGASLTAGVLEILDLDMGRNFASPSKAGAKGGFEDIPFVPAFVP